MTIPQLIEMLYEALPSPKLTGLSFDPAGNYVEFRWFNTDYRVSTDLMVDELEGNLVGGGPIPSLMKALLRRTPTPEIGE